MRARPACGRPLPRDRATAFGADPHESPRVRPIEVPAGPHESVSLQRRERGVGAAAGEAPKRSGDLDPRDLALAGREEVEHTVLVAR